MDMDPHRLLSAYAMRLGRRDLAPGTVKKYRASVARWLDWLGDRDPAAATSRDVDDYLDEIASAGAAPATIRLHIAALKSFYKYLGTRDVLAAGNPVADVERPRSRRRPVDYLDVEEDAALLAAPINPQEQIVVHLLRWTGTRVGEACSLTWRDVDFDGGWVYVRKSKTDSGLRGVPLLPELEAELRDWRRHLEGVGLYSQNGPVLVTANRTHMKPAFVWRLVKRVAGRAGVRERPAPDKSGWNVSAITDHTLRRTYATDLLNRNVPDAVVAESLGHADTRTVQLYAKLRPETVKAAVLRAYAS